MPESANRAVATGKIHYVSHDFLGQGAARCEAVVIHFANHLELQKLAGRQQPPPPDAVRLSSEEARLLKEEARRKQEAEEARLRALFEGDDDPPAKQHPEENKSKSEQVMQPQRGESKKFDQRRSEREMEELRRRLAESRAASVPQIAPLAKPDPDGWRLGNISGAAGKSMLIYRDPSHRTHEDFDREHQWKGDDFDLIGALKGITAFPELKKFAAGLASYRLDEAPKGNGADRSGFPSEDERKGWPVIMPVPADAPLPTPKSKDGYRFEMQHVYRDRDDRVLWAVDRYVSTAIPEAGKKRQKSFRPWTWRCPPGQPGRAQWAPYAPAGDLPLYGLDRLPGASQVLLVEGERKADIAQAMALPAGTATLSYGATGKVEMVDFSPLQGLLVVGWPDHDASGRKAMVAALLRCEGAGAIDPRMVAVPADFPDAWDLADDWPGGEDDPDTRACAMIAAAIPVSQAVAELAQEKAGGRQSESQSETVQPRRPLPTVRGGDVVRWKDQEPEEVTFAVADYFPMGFSSLVVGATGAGKTILIQMIASGLVALPSFMGKALFKGSAACLNAEDPARVLHARQERMNRALGIDYDQLEGKLFIQSYFGHDARLWVDRKPTELLKQFRDELGEIEKLRLADFDNVSFFYGGDQSDPGEVAAFLTHINGMADELRCALLLNTHTSKSYSADNPDFAHAGTMAWQNHVRAVVELTRAKENAPPLLKLIKRNLVAPQPDIAFKWVNGLLIPDLPDLGIIGTVERRKAEHVFLDLLDQFTGSNRKVSESDRASNYAPKVFADLPPKDRDNLTKGDLRRAMEGLFRAGQITNQDYGPRSKPRSMIIRTPYQEPNE